MPAIFLTSSTGNVAEELKNYQERELAGWVKAYLRAQTGSAETQNEDLAERARQEIMESAVRAAECYAGK